MPNRKLALISSLIVCFSAAASAGTIVVTLDTRALVADTADQVYGVDFFIENGDLIRSGSPGGSHTNPSNIVTISNFDFGGGYGFDPATDSGYGVFGGASGDIRSSVTLLNNRQSNELFQDFFPGNYLRFTLTYTNNVSGSDLIDIFNFGLTDGNFSELPTLGGSIFPSFLEVDFDSTEPFVEAFASDPDSPTSAGMFLTIDAPTIVQPASTPEPATFWMLGAALLILPFRRKVGERTRRVAIRAGLVVILAAVFGAQGMKAATADDSPELFTALYRGRHITYQRINGYAVVGGDMVIGELSASSEFAAIEQPVGRKGNGLSQNQAVRLNPQANSVNVATHLWPKVAGIVTIPYTFVKGNAVFMPAITEFNRLFAGKIQLVPRTNQRNYVEINLNDQSSNSCYATLGYVGGKEILQGVAKGCGLSANMHEIGHLLGLAHEHSRQDRDLYMFVDFNNLSPASQGAYAQNFSDNMDLGLYDYTSLMHYAPRGFSRNGNPDMESIPVGLPFGDPPTFSAGDYDAVNRLYFSAPTQITVNSNPAGLPIIVDGATLTAPQTFNWALNSQHTLSVPAGPQSIGGSTYVFGRWNSDFAGNLSSNQAITVTPGSGGFGSPTTSPAVTVYQVNYIHLVQFTPTVLLDNSTSASAGSVSSNPVPSTFPGVTGQFFVDRALVTVTANPAAGNSFHDFSGDNTFQQTFGPATNPLTVPADLLTGKFNVSLTSTPEVIVTTNITDNNASGVKVVADSGTARSLPTAWSSPYDSGWNTGTTHSLSAVSPVSPENDASTKYTFTGWSDGFTEATRLITVPATGNVSVGANYKTSYHVSGNVNTPCGGSISVGTLPAGGFVDKGTTLLLTATPTFPWLFASWSGTVTGSTNPLSTTANGEVVGTAVFNLVSAPLAITSISPSSFAVGSPAQTITITGTGFTPDSTTFYLTGDYLSRDVIYINATTLKVDLLASDFAAPAASKTTITNATAACSLDANGPPILVHQ